jgi:hypothetical protein
MLRVAVQKRSSMCVGDAGSQSPLSTGLLPVGAIDLARHADVCDWARGSVFWK